MIHDLLTGLTWYLILTGFGIVVLPLSMTIFRRMPEGGILLARPLGWLLLAGLSWWLAYLGILSFSPLGILLVGFVLLAVSCGLLLGKPQWMYRTFRIHWRTALNGEVLAILAFVLILLARREDPAISTTEKPMDIMMLNALVETTTIPPQDPWLAGYPINYHYGGYLLHAIPIKLTGIHPEIGYNLAFPTVAFLGVCIAFVLGRALFGRCRWGALTPVCIFFIGNLAGLSGFLERLSFPPNMHDWRFGYLWNTSRVIKDTIDYTINEYPFFTILWGDLHPHFSDIPFTLFFFSLVYAVLLALLRLHPKHLVQFEWPLIVIAIFSCGFIFPTNVFDFPIVSLFFGGVLASVILYRCWKAGRNWQRYFPYMALFLIPIAGYLFAFPFWNHFVPPDQGTQIKVAAEHTDFMEFLLVFGLHFAATLAFFFLRGQKLIEEKSKEEVGFFLSLLGIFFFVIWAWYGYLICALAPCCALLFWILVLQSALQSSARTQQAMVSELFALVACALAWSLIAGCEFFYLKDNYGIARMNTIFKFHFPAWFFFGMGLPYLLYREFKQCAASYVRWFVMLPVLGLLVLSLIPPVYTLTWVYRMPDENRWPITLDGLAFLRQGQSHHYAIIEWVRNHTEPTDVILEVPGCGYRMESTIAAFTGRPTVIGWVNHEALWHRANIDQEIYTRKTDVEQFYSTQNWNRARDILKQYQVKYVAYLTPECDDKKALLPQMEKGIFRRYLEPIIQAQNPAGFRQARFELYKVPENL